METTRTDRNGAEWTQVAFGWWNERTKTFQTTAQWNRENCDEDCCVPPDWQKPFRPEQDDIWVKQANFLGRNQS